MIFYYFYMRQLKWVQQHFNLPPHANFAQIMVRQMMVFRRQAFWDELREKLWPGTLTVLGRDLLQKHIQGMDQSYGRGNWQVQTLTIGHTTLLQRWVKAAAGKLLGFPSSLPTLWVLCVRTAPHTYALISQFEPFDAEAMLRLYPEQATWP